MSSFFFVVEFILFKMFEATKIMLGFDFNKIYLNFSILNIYFSLLFTCCNLRASFVKIALQALKALITLWKCLKNVSSRMNANVF